MTMFSRILIGTAGLAATFAVASPAAAQSYPYGGYGNQNSGGIVGAIVNAVTGGGYGQYPQGNYGYGQVNQRQAVAQCAAATEQRLNGGYGNQRYGGYNNGYQGGYGNQYGYAQGGARIVGITHVQRRNNGGLRVTGVATSGQGYAQQGYNPYGNRGYGYANQQADLRFSCKVNARGQVSDIDIDRAPLAYRRGY